MVRTFYQILVPFFFIILIFSCARQKNLAEVSCFSDIKALEKIVDELEVIEEPNQVNIQTSVCMIVSKEDELSRISKRLSKCLPGTDALPLIEICDGKVRRSDMKSGERSYKVVINQCYADSVKGGLVLFEFRVDSLNLITQVLYRPLKDARKKVRYNIAD